MKIFHMLFWSFFFIPFSFSQAPGIEWENTIGGNTDDFLFTAKSTMDGGYILAGSSSSVISDDKAAASIQFDFWVLKLDNFGAIEWQTTIFGDNDEYQYSHSKIDITQTADGGYILGGSSNSGDAYDKEEENLAESYDMWILKLSASGNIEWQNTIGGAGTDYFSVISPLSDGGFILGGSSSSPVSFDKTEASWGGHDYWLLKLDNLGNIVWQNTIGGDQDDWLSDVKVTPDDGFILSGVSNSNISGDKTEANTLGDFWIVKIDEFGSIDWQNTIAGPSSEFAPTISLAPDGGYLTCGSSLSGIGLDKIEPQIGIFDLWVIKLNVSGEIEWQQTIGGGNSEQNGMCANSPDGNFIIAGYSNSGISGDKTDASHGAYDYWIVKINALGNIVWQSTIGGWGDDILMDVNATNDNGFILSGYSNSEASFDKSEDNLGNWPSYDYWVVKLEPDSCYISTEICNGLDDDCNGIIDDSFIYTTYFADIDGDNFGDIDNTTTTCTGFPPLGYVVDSTDCNDLNILIHPDAIELCNGFDDNCNILIDEGLALYTFYFDADVDGFGDAAALIILCNPTLPTGYSTDSTDCNDDNMNVFPGAIELCNSIDDNCNGSIDEGFTLFVYFLDSDEDGFGDPDFAIYTCLFPAPEGYVADNTDCDDSNVLIYTPILYYTDADGDLYGDALSPVWICDLMPPTGYSINDEDCDDTAFLINPGSNEICNGLDDNCNLEIDEGLAVFVLYADADGDDYGDKNFDTITCNANVVGYVNDSTDCDDTNPFINPGATEILNGIDDDCDKLIDEGFTGIEDQMSNSKITIYPNPANDFITIQTDFTTEKTIYLTNALGQILQTIITKENTFTIKINNICSGIYFIKVEDGINSLTEKFIKQ